MPKGIVYDDGDPGNLRGKRIGLIKPEADNTKRIPFENGVLWRTPKNGKTFRDSKDPTFKKNANVTYDAGTRLKVGWAVNVAPV